MRKIPVFILCVMTALLGSLICTAEETARTTCSKCNKGKVTCKVHKGKTPPKFLCSVCIEVPCGCCSIGWTPCKDKKCPFREAAEKEFADITVPMKTWLAGSRAAVEGKSFADDKKLKEIKGYHIQNGRFHFGGTLKRTKARYLDKKGRVKYKTYEPHQLLHLYLERLEDLYARFKNLLDLEKDFGPSMSPRWRVFCWLTEKQQQAVSYKIAGLSTSNNTLWLPDFYSTWNEAGDDFLYHRIVHSVAILLNEDYNKYVYNGIPVWLDEAIAHWLEYDIFGVLQVFNEGEVTFQPNCPVKKLRKIIKLELKSKGKRLPPLRSFLEHDLDNLSGWERIKGWSLVDWLKNACEKGTLRKLNVEFNKTYPDTKDQTIAFKNVLKMTCEDIDEAWSKWVLETYR